MTTKSDKVMLPDPVGHVSEFVGGYKGDCLETAFAIAAGAARGFVVTPQFQLDIIHEMGALGWLLDKTSGATNIDKIIDYAKYKQYRTLAEIRYSEPFQGDAHKLLLDHAGKHPIVLNIANGQALVDAETGSGENAVNLHYHAIAVVGKQSDGYICADGDNYQVSQHFQIYTWDTIEAAQPCGALVLDMQRPASNTYTVQPGDSLWAIVHHLIEQGKVHANYSAAQLYASNEATIGGNPNLIYPGEVLHYP